jgi:AbrB family looped-hinge helix DNA binding protein
MRTTIDAAGRLIVPKPLRDALGLSGGETLEIIAVDGRLEVDVKTAPMHLEPRASGLVAVPEVDMPPLTARDVRDTLDRVRR